MASIDFIAENKNSEKRGRNSFIFHPQMLFSSRSKGGSSCRVVLFTEAHYYQIF
jgi:hypothetical protein